MKKGFKIAAAIIGGLVLISILTADKKEVNAGAPTPSAAQPSVSTTASWKPVANLKGNGAKKGPTFHLNGGEARISYKYKGEHNTGMFAVYIVDKGVDIMKDGGVPEVMISAVEETSESYITKSAGDYYIDVNAVGSWDVTVEEKM